MEQSEQQTQEQNSGTMPLRPVQEPATDRIAGLEQELRNLKAQVANIAERVHFIPSAEKIAGLVDAEIQSVKNTLAGMTGQLPDVIARMKGFLDKYVSHETPAVARVVNVVRDAQGFLRDEQGSVVPYKSDATGAITDLQGVPLKVVESFRPAA